MEITVEFNAPESQSISFKYSKQKGEYFQTSPSDSCDHLEFISFGQVNTQKP